MWYDAECMNEAEKCIQILKLKGNMKARNHMKDLDVDGGDDNKMDLEETGCENVNWQKLESSDSILLLAIVLNNLVT